ncbi:uncharacterized protein EI90DRAFT_2872209, partial [Cantharellus anzutake]
ITPTLLWKSDASLILLGTATSAFLAHGLRLVKGITPTQIDSWVTASNYAI